MTCRMAFATSTAQAPLTAKDRLETIDRLSEGLLDAMEHGASSFELQIRALEIQGHACIGAAFERRRGQEVRS